MEWRELADAINSDSDYQILRIQSDRKHYERCSIQRAVLHEDLFSVFLRWEAIFDKSRKSWVWESPPNDDGSPVDALDNDVSGKYYKPRSFETSYGNIIRIGEDAIVFPEFLYPIDPIVEVSLKERQTIAENLVYGGVFVLPPSYRIKLYVNQIQSPR